MIFELEIIPVENQRLEGSSPEIFPFKSRDRRVAAIESFTVIKVRKNIVERLLSMVV